MRKTIHLKVIVIFGSVLVGLASIEFGIRKYDNYRSTKKVLSHKFFEGQSDINLQALNYNDTSIATQKEVGTYRILSFGDSFAYSVLRYPFTYHQVAAEELSLRAQIPVRIVNFGEPAISFYQYMNAYRLWGKVVEHDAAIFNIFMGNDLLDVANSWVDDDSPIHKIFLNLDVNLNNGLPRQIQIPQKYPLRFMDYLYASYLMAFQKLVPVRTLPGPEYNWALSELAKAEFLKTHFLQSDNFNFQKLKNIKAGYVAAIQFARFLQEIVQKKVPVFVLLSPSQFQIETALQEEVAQLHGLDLSTLDIYLSAYLIYRIIKEIAPNAHVINFAEALDCAHQQNAKMYVGTDTHWSLAGNRVVGQQIVTSVGHHLFSLPVLARSPGDLSFCGTVSINPGKGLQDTPDRTKAFEEFIRPLIKSAPLSGRM